MSHTPMPGAQPGVTRLPYQDVTHDNFPTLLACDAINFTDVQPVTLKPGRRLYRVFGTPAGAVGSYWSPEPPGAKETEPGWRGKTAVELSWNSGVKVCELVAGQEGLQAWVGGIAPQPAQDTNCQYLPGYLLPGGGRQYKTFKKGLIPTVVWPTPWARTSHKCPPTIPAAPSPPSRDATPAAHAAHASHLEHLAQNFHRLADSEPDRVDLSAISDRLSITYEEYRRYLDRIDEPAAVAHLQHHALAHLGLHRHVFIDVASPLAAEAERSLQQVIRSAAGLRGLLPEGHDSP